MTEIDPKIQGRHWSFTLHNWSEVHKSLLICGNMKCRYIVYGEELCKDGHPHLQGYMYFSQSIMWKTIKKRCPDISYLVQAFAEQRLNLYCQKGEQSHEEWEELGEAGPNYGKNAKVYKEGVMPEQGKRKDLDEFCDLLKDGVPLHQAKKQLTSTYARYHAGLDKLAKTLCPKLTYADFPPIVPLLDHNVMVFLGPTQIGKSQWAKAHFPQGSLFISHFDRLQEFNPEVHSGIVFDDMSYKHLPPETQKYLTDWNDDRDIHIRYTTVHIPKHTRKIFTCNAYPFLDDDSEHARAIRIRFTLVECKKRDENFFYKIL